MATCRRCRADTPPEELIRHELPGLTLVHCPVCEAFMGRYRRHGDAPQTDRLRG